jgi:gluconate 2-dehydrogenase alpha chain
MTATKLKPVDVVTVGVGVTGSIAAKELADAGLRVVGLERGAPRDTHPDFDMPGIHDELRYARRFELMQDLSRETLTFRNAAGETALPMRQLGSFLPGEGLGGAGVHWNGQTRRFLPWDFETRSRSVARYGPQAFAADCTSQDWGVTYAELEPHYDRFEQVFGIGGRAGNIRGEIRPGGNPFEGPRSRDYPNPPMKDSYATALFAEAARSLGYRPFPLPSANMTRGYTNAYGLTMGPCVYCGYCERFGCEMGAKASPQTAVLPAVLGHPNYELRTRANVLRINLDSQRRRAVSVTYLDARGREFEQPAELVLLTSYVFGNVRHMLLSGIGRPYDPATNEGVVGRNYAYQCTSGVTAFFEDQQFNPFMGAGALGSAVDEFNGANFDHSGLGFVGGGFIACTSSGSRPIDSHPVPPATPRWGAGWKKAVARYYGRSLGLYVHGAVQSYRGNYLDIDPIYRDACGLPLLRMTFDFHDNERLMSQHLTARAAAIAKALRPSAISASAFLQNAGYNPTGTIGALTYRAIDAIKNRYLKQPGPLAG